MHIFRSRFLVRAEVWYDHEPTAMAVDWILYRQRPQPVPGSRWKYFYTVLLDLRPDPEALLRQMSKTNAYKIRRARDRDGIVCESMNPVGRPMLDSFEETYKRFATIKGLAPLDRPFLDQMAKEGFLELSLAKAPGGEPLAYHVYYCDGDRSCLLHAVSLYQTLTNSATRNAMGRANRYLFWCDILRHRARALKAFDFGGWYPGTTDQGLLDINRFKEEFGGNVVREYNCEQILTLKGHLALSAAAWLDRIQRAAAQLRAGPARPKPQHETADAKPVSSGRSPAAELREVREPELTNG